MIRHMRTLVDIPDQLLKEIDAVAKREAISRAEAVRRAMAKFVAERTSPATDSAFGIWKSRDIDALEYEDSVRDEWTG